MKKRVKILALVLGMALFTCSCQKLFTDNEHGIFASANSIDGERIQGKLDVINPAAYGNINGLTLEPGSYISIIGRYSGDSYWEEVEKGAQMAVDDLNDALGYKGDDKIELAFCAPKEKDDIDDQISIFDEELARYPVAICIASIDATAFEVQFDLANENKIPVVTFDSGSDFKNVTAHVSTKNYDAAQAAADNLASLMDGEGEVVVFVQDSLSMAATEREAGFVDTIKKNYPDISVVDVYHFDELETYAKEMVEAKHPDYSDAEVNDKAASISQESVIKEILNKHPNLKGVFTTNLDTTQAVADVVTSLENDELYFVGFDGGEEQIELLKNDTLDGLILQNPYGMGYAAVVAATRSVMEEKNNEAVIDTGYTWITKNNLDSRAIQQLLY